MSSPTISLIAALAENRVIGANNGLPWHLPADLKRFRTLTMGKPVLMGRKTFISIGKPLPGRTNIVVTRDDHFVFRGVTVVHSVVEALASVKDTDEVMIIGGASFYAQMLPHAHRLYLTTIHHNFPGDAYFPAWETQDWWERGREDHILDTDAPYPYSFIILERRAHSVMSADVGP